MQDINEPLFRDLSSASIQIETGRTAVSIVNGALWNGAATLAPAVLVRCSDLGNVKDAVRIARNHGVPVSVLGGGHDWAARAVCAGGVTLDLRALSSVEISHGDATITVGGGAIIGDVMDILPDDLAAVTGNWSSVGVAGITLGGGYGKLNSRFGLVADTLLRAEVVLADGSLVVASPQDDTELFWALRGGGGNFGAVVSMTFAAFRVSQVLNGVFFIPLASAKAGLIAVQEILDESNDDLSIYSALATVPGAGRGLILVPMWTGGLEGERHLSALAKLEGSHTIMQGWSTYRDSYDKTVEASAPKGLGYHLDAHNVPGFDDRVASALVEAAQEFTSDRDCFILHDFHGAAARVSPDATAFAFRQNHINVQAITSWNPGADENGDKAAAWLAHVRAALAPSSVRGGYPNLLGPQEQASVRAFYGDAAPRLALAKARYDPDDQFSSNTGRLGPLPPYSES